MASKKHPNGKPSRRKIRVTRRRDELTKPSLAALLRPIDSTPLVLRSFVATPVPMNRQIEAKAENGGSGWQQIEADEGEDTSMGSHSPAGSFSLTDVLPWHTLRQDPCYVVVGEYNGAINFNV